MDAPLSRLYPILDAALLPKSPALRERYIRHAAAVLAAAGVTILQYRNKAGAEQEVLREATMLRALAPPSLRILLNDHAHLVEAAGCDGVHIGQGDLPVGEARRLVGPERIVGLSTHTFEQVQAGEHTTADYLAIGPVYATGTKLDAAPVIRLDGLREARRWTGKPLVAIGGITAARAPEVLSAGADAVAVISALFAEAADAGWTEQGSRLRKLAEDFLHNFR